MTVRPCLLGLLVVQLAGTSTVLASAEESARIDEPRSQLTSEALLQTLEPPGLAELAREVLERSPEVARALQRAAAEAARAPQARALPDPTATLGLFVLPPETRVGPQRLSIAVSQRLPWLGKLSLRERAALYGAAAAAAEVEVRRLDLLTEARELYYRLAFHEEHERIVDAERATLARYEEAARARYTAGTGTQQEILRIQAEITRIDTRSLKIREHRAKMLAALNALRDRPARTPVADLVLPLPTVLEVGAAELRAAATERPELAASGARVAQRQTLAELAELQFRPDFNLGLGLVLVDGRDDAAGRASPPEGDGDDILSLTGSMNLPIRRGKLEAGLEEALAEVRAAEEDRRRILAEIEREVGDLEARLPLLYDHWLLLENVLFVQALEALRSAEAAYSTGKLNAVDLLDSEVVLLDVRTAAAQTLADYAVARAQLERAISRPLLSPTELLP